MSRASRAAAATAVTAVAACAVALVAMGRRAWCACGSPRPWSGDIWSSHNSQHLADPYAFSHVTHGLLFFVLFARLRVAPAWRFAMAIVLEAAWEVLENTPWVLERYRRTTMSLEYYGDSVANALGDVAACAAGYLLATRLSVRGALAGVAFLELALGLWIRDGVLLNLLMLVWPLESVRRWQTGG